MATPMSNQCTPRLLGTTLSGNAGVGSGRGGSRSSAGATGGRERGGLGANRGVLTLGTPTPASNGSVTVAANARLRAVAQSRQIFAPGGHSLPQILHFIDPFSSGSQHSLPGLAPADPYDNGIMPPWRRAAPAPQQASTMPR